MHTFELSPEEMEVLREILQHELTQMEIEIFRTDSPDFKQILKHRRDILEQLMRKCSSALVSV